MKHGQMMMSYKFLETVGFSTYLFWLGLVGIHRLSD